MPGNRFLGLLKNWWMLIQHMRRLPSAEASALSARQPEFLGVVGDGRRFEIQGLNVWEHDWTPLGRFYEVTEPRYKSRKQFQAYAIISGDKRIEFLAREFANTIWGFYRCPD